MPLATETTRLLLHCEGVVGTQSLRNDAPGGGGSPKIITNGGTLSGDQARFGYTSNYCYGSANNTTIAPSIDFNFGRADFTVEGWFYVLANPYLFCWWEDYDNFFGLEHVSTGGDKVTLRLRWRLAGRDLGVSDLPWPPSQMIDGWHHVAVMRNGIYCGWFLDGIWQKYFLLPSGQYPVNLGNWPLYVGRSPQSGRSIPGHLHGYFDEFRVSAQMIPVSPDPPAASVFVVPQIPYTPIYESGGVGVRHIRRLIESGGSGVHAIGVRPIESGGNGYRLIRRAIESGAAPSRPIRRPIESGGRGIYSIGSTTAGQVRLIETGGMGSRSVRRAIETGGRGERHVQSRYIESGGSGYRHIRRLGESGGVGTRRIRRQISGGGDGQRKIKWDGDTYELYIGAGTSPDYDAPPAQTYTSLPIQYTLPASAGLYYCTVRVRNRLGLLEQNLTEFVCELDAQLQSVTPVPSGPGEAALTPAANGDVRVTAMYRAFEDGERVGDKWLVYATGDGSDPDPAQDTPQEFAMRVVDAFARLSVLLTGYQQDDTVKAIVRVKRSSDGRESTNTNIVTTTANAGGPAAVTVQAYHRVGAVLIGSS